MAETRLLVPCPPDENGIGYRIESSGSDDSGSGDGTPSPERIESQHSSDGPAQGLAMEVQEEDQGSEGNDDGRLRTKGVGGKRGRKRVPHPVHSYFKKINRDQDMCLLPSKQVGQTCRELVGSPNSTNLLSHLKNHHPEEYKEVMKLRPRGKKAGGRSKSDLKATFDSDKCDFALAAFCAANAISFRALATDEFQHFISTLHPNYKIPSRKRMPNLIAYVTRTMDEQLRDELKECDEICLALDIWSRYRLTASYLGIKLHYITPSGLKSAVLALAHLPYPHTGLNVLQCLRTVLDAWNIRPERVTRVICDGGSNLLKALRLSWPDEDDFFESYSDDNDSASAHPADGTADEAAAVVDTDDDAAVLRAISADGVFNETVGKELDSQLGLLRGPCICHLAQGIVKRFDIAHVRSCSARKRARAIFNFFRHSGKATEALAAVSTNGIISYSHTRWSSGLQAYERLVSLRPHIEPILTAQNARVSTLSQSEWTALEEYILLTRPLADLTYHLEAELTPTASFVIPHIDQLVIKLKSIPGDASAQLLALVNSTFDEFTNPSNPKFDGFFVAAAALHPKVAQFMSADHHAAADRYISEHIPSASRTAAAQTVTAAPTGSPLDTLFSSVSPSSSSLAARIPSLEYAQYKVAGFHLPIDGDQVAFWQSLSAPYPSLSRLALRIITVPASSASIERVFSAAGTVLGIRRGALSHEALENSVKLKANKRFLLSSPYL